MRRGAKSERLPAWAGTRVRRTVPELPWGGPLTAGALAGLRDLGRDADPEVRHAAAELLGASAAA